MKMEAIYLCSGTRLGGGVLGCGAGTRDQRLTLIPRHQDFLIPRQDNPIGLPSLCSDSLGTFGVPGNKEDPGRAPLSEEVETAKVYTWLKSLVTSFN